MLLCQQESTSHQSICAVTLPDAQRLNIWQWLLLSDSSGLVCQLVAVCRLHWHGMFTLHPMHVQKHRTYLLHWPQRRGSQTLLGHHAGLQVQSPAGPSCLGRPGTHRYPHKTGGSTSRNQCTAAFPQWSTQAVTSGVLRWHPQVTGGNWDLNRHGNMPQLGRSHEMAILN